MDKAARGVALLGVIAAALALAVLWVYMVPMLEASDESEHFDYVLALAHAGRLLPGRPVMDPIMTATADDETRLFETYSDFYRIYLNRHARVPSGYGTPQYFQAIDRRAAARFPDYLNYWDDAQRPKPGLIDLYPAGYYAANALWLRVFSLFDRSQVAQFFAARWFSVGLLAITLVFVYGLARELRLQAWLALALTAVIGMHSLTSFVASYVQPDNLALTLISVILFVSVRIVRRGVRVRGVAMLGAALGALAITKYQFFACVALVVACTAAVEILRRPRFRAELLVFGTLLAAPATTALLLQHAIVGSDPMYVRTHLESALPNFADPPAVAAWLGTFGALALQAFYHFFVGGFNSELDADPHYSGSISYWGNSGWLDTPLSFGNSATNTLVHLVIQWSNVAIIILTVVWVLRTLLRLGKLALKGKPGTVFRLAVANTPLNLYFTFTAFMVFFFALTNNAWRVSGRTWIPVIEPAFLLGIVYAPRAIVQRRLRIAFRSTVLVFLGLYATVGSYYAALSVHDRYYGGPFLPPLSALIAGPKSEISIQRLFSAPADSAIDAPINLQPQVPQGDIYHISGWAADVASREAAGGVIALVDGRDEFAATYGYSNVQISEQLHNFRYYWAGYQFFIPTNNLSVGAHSVSFYIVSSDLTRFFQASQTVRFTVLPPTLPLPYELSANGNLVGSIDRIGSQSFTNASDRPLWLSNGDALSANGWLIDVRDKRTLKYLYATVDGNARYRARVLEPRLDLIPPFPTIPVMVAGSAGFSIVLPLQKLAPGPHRIAFSAVMARASRPISLLQNFPFTIHAPQGDHDTIHTAGIAWPTRFGDGKRISGFLDEVTNLDLATDHSWLAAPVWLSPDNVMFVRGWALDLVHGLALNHLWITIDADRRFAVRAGGFRTDIPQAYPALAWQSTYYSGFTAAIPMSQFRPGQHRLTLWTVDPADKRSLPLIKDFPFTIF